MAKRIFFGINNIARKAVKAYLGVEGTARTIKKAYVGIEDVARQIWPSVVPAGEIIFTSSQTWIVPDGVSKIDVFCVGGGSSGQMYYAYELEQIDSYYDAAPAGGGGGGGYTATSTDVTVTPGQEIAVVVGAGGALRTTYGNNAGGVSSFGAILSANGGTTSENRVYTRSRSENYGTHGGSGGGAGGIGSDYGFTRSYGANGGSDGANGDSAYEADDGTTIHTLGGTGQGVTTRAFGEASGIVYAGGGGGGCGKNGSYPLAGGYGYGANGGGVGGRAYNEAYLTYLDGGNATPNTGSGGGGGGVITADVGSYTDVYIGKGGAGGSGIVIVRWEEQ